MQPTRRTILAGLAGAALLPQAWAQDRYPTRPIRIVVTNAAGGASDMIARMLGTGLTAALGQAVAVEPMPAANGMIALQALTRAPADGYTLCVTHSAVVTNEPVDRTGMPDLPTTWIVTLRDNSLKPKLQREFIANLGNVDEVIELDTCHNAMMSEPDHLAALLLARR